jgi:hypothetical protein
MVSSLNAMAYIPFFDRNLIILSGILNEANIGYDLHFTKFREIFINFILKKCNEFMQVLHPYC